MRLLADHGTVLGDQWTPRNLFLQAFLCRLRELLLGHWRVVPGVDGAAEVGDGLPKLSYSSRLLDIDAGV